jgi:hypothetical protein
MRKITVLLLIICFLSNIIGAYGSAAEPTSESVSYQVIPVDGRIKTIEITPYQVDTKILRDEFEAFKIQYAIIWTLLGGALIYAVSHR